MAGERKAVNFSDEKEELQRDVPTSVISSAPPTKQVTESRDNGVVEFLQPVVISVCTWCLVRLLQAKDTPPLALLNRLLCGYASGGFLKFLFQKLQSEDNAEHGHDVLRHNLANSDVSPSDGDGARESIVLVNYLMGLVSREEEKEGLWVELLIECSLSVLHCGSVSQVAAISLLQDMLQVMTFLHPFTSTYM